MRKEFGIYYWEGITLVQAQQAVSVASDYQLEIQGPEGKKRMQNEVRFAYSGFPIVTQQDAA